MLRLLVSSDRKWTLCVCQCLSMCFHGFSSRHVVQFTVWQFSLFFHHIFSWGVLTGLLVCFGARRNKSCLFEEFEKARGLLMKQKNPEACWKVRWCWTCLSAQDTRCQFRKSATSGQGNVHELCLKKVSCLKLQKTRPRKRTHGFKKFQWKNMSFTLNIHTLPTNKKTRISIWIKK